MKLLHSFMLLFILNTQVYADNNMLISGCELFIDVASQRDLDGHNTVSAFMAGTCAGIMRGYLGSTYIYNRKYLAAPYCLPEQVSPPQLAKVFLKYVNSHPEKLHLSESTIIAASFSEAFPCP